MIHIRDSVPNMDLKSIGALFQVLQRKRNRDGCSPFLSSPSSYREGRHSAGSSAPGNPIPPGLSGGRRTPGGPSGAPLWEPPVPLPIFPNPRAPKNGPFLAGVHCCTYCGCASMIFVLPRISIRSARHAVFEFPCPRQLRRPGNKRRQSGPREKHCRCSAQPSCLSRQEDHIRHHRLESPHGTW